MQKSLFVVPLFASLVLAQPLVISRVTVIDATGKPAQPDMTVVIEHGRIVSISPWKQAKGPENAQVVDGAGKFLIPGLWDMHGHGAAETWTHGLLLANGVVGVRDMFGPEDANGWRAKHSADQRPAPTIFFGSPILDGPEPVLPTFISVATEAQGREVVDRYKEHGSDFIKVYSRMPREAYFAIADEAHKRGISFVGHVPYSVTAAEASDAGQKSMEHLMGVEVACSNREKALTAEAPRTYFAMLRRDELALQTYDDATAQALFARFVKNGTWQCPTLTIIRMNAKLNDAKLWTDDRFKYVPKSERADFDPRNPPYGGATKEDLAAFQVKFRKDLKLLGRMHRAGVGILAGSDSFNPDCFPGFSLHDELALLVEAGLSPMAALQAATSNAARFMGQLDRRGTIETGKIADLILLDKDPLADIHNTRAIQAVVLSGKLMKRAALDAMLAEAEAAANK